MEKKYNNQRVIPKLKILWKRCDHLNGNFGLQNGRNLFQYISSNFI